MSALQRALFSIYGSVTVPGPDVSFIAAFSAAATVGNTFSSATITSGTCAVGDTIAVIGWGNDNTSGSVMTCSDSVGNTYSLKASQAASAGGWAMLWTTQATTTGSNVVSVVVMQLLSVATLSLLSVMLILR
jgi:hypothetical protein